MREEQHHHQNDPGGEGARQRRARAAAFVDERLRHAAADRETAAQSGGEIGRGEREEFLVGVEPAAMFGGEHAADGGRLHRAEQKTGERQRQQFVQIRPVNRGESEGRQSLRHFAQQLHPARFQAEPARSHNAADHDEQRHGFVLEKNLPEHEHGQRGASNRERRGIGFVQVLQEVAAVLPEIAVRAVDAEQLGQLRAGEEQRHAALESDHHAFGDEVDDRARLDQPGDEGDERHEQGRARRQRAEPASCRRPQFRLATRRPAARWRR